MTQHDRIHNQPSRPRRPSIADGVWIVYFSLVPVVWLPGIEPASLNIIKVALFGLGVLVTWSGAERRQLPKGLLGPVGLALVCISAVFSLFQASTLVVAYRQLGEFLVAFVMLWSFAVLQSNHRSFQLVASTAGVVHALMSVVIVSSALGLVSIRAPEALGGLSTTDVGFAGARTGWSATVAIFLPFVVARALTGRSRTERTAMYAAGVVTVLGQVAVGGRAGLLAGLVGILVVVLVRYGVRGLVAPIAAAALAVFAAAGYIYERLRLGQLYGPSGLNFDRLSSGRLSQLESSWRLVAERPIKGFGAEGARLAVQGSEARVLIHNVWLRLAAEGGVLLLTAFVAVVATAIARGLRTVLDLRETNSPVLVSAAAAWAALLVGGVVSLFEPAVLLGAMHAASIWWASAGVLSLGAAGFVAYSRAEGPSGIGSRRGA